MTYRLMGEWATDMACRKLGVEAKCMTAVIPLPGSENEESKKRKSKSHIIELSTEQKAAVGRHGTIGRQILDNVRDDDAVVCECEQVSVGEVKYAISELHVRNLVNLRRRTRMGMGTCQGGLCACRAAGIMADANNCAESALNDLQSFINERWKGMNPVGWGDTLDEAQFMSWLIRGVGGLSGSEIKK